MVSVEERVCPHCAYIFQPWETSCPRCGWDPAQGTAADAPTDPLAPPPPPPPGALASSGPLPAGMLPALQGRPPLPPRPHGMVWLGVYISFWPYLLGYLLLAVVLLSTLCIGLQPHVLREISYASYPSTQQSPALFFLLIGLIVVVFALASVSNFLWLRRATSVLQTASPCTMWLTTTVEYPPWWMRRYRSARLWAALDGEMANGVPLLLTTFQLYWPAFSLFWTLSWQNRRSLVTVYQDGDNLGGPIVLQDEHGKLLCASCPIGYPLRGLS